MILIRDLLTICYFHFFYHLSDWVEIFSIFSNSIRIQISPCIEPNINSSDIICRLGEHIEIRPGPTSNTTSFFLLLSSGGLIVYLLYKSLNDENQSGVQHQPPQLTDTVRFDEFLVQITLDYFGFLARRPLVGWAELLRTEVSVDQ